jgi:hypothetical protein
MIRVDKKKQEISRKNLKLTTYNLELTTYNLWAKPTSGNNELREFYRNFAGLLHIEAAC